MARPLGSKNQPKMDDLKLPEPWATLWSALKPARDIYRRRAKNTVYQAGRTLTPEQRARKNAYGRAYRAAKMTSSVHTGVDKAPSTVLDPCSVAGEFTP